jgi:hypothetical protein
MSDELPPHLYRDARGVVRDRVIEQLCASLERGEALDAEAMAQLKRLAAMFGDAPTLPADVLSNVAAALDWAGGIGLVNFTRLRPELHKAEATRIAAQGLRYVCYLETTRRSAPAMAPTIPHAVVGAVVQTMREQAATQNNLLRPTSTAGRPN